MDTRIVLLEYEVVPVVGVRKGQQVVGERRVVLVAVLPALDDAQLGLALA